MANAKVKTVVTEQSVTDFINTVEDDTKRKDCFTILEIMQKQSGFDAKMWGPSIIGFGSYHYVYESGREGDAPLVAFSPRKNEISLYLSSSFENRAELLAKLGKHKSAKACIYIKKLSDVDVAILNKMVALSVKHVKSCTNKKVVCTFFLCNAQSYSSVQADNYRLCHATTVDNSTIDNYQNKNCHTL